jgi:uncharacterized membrane protein YraQ (UPF0718 family)
MGNKKIYIIGGIVLLVIAGVSIGAYFLVKKKNKESDELKSNEKTTSTSPAKLQKIELIKSMKPKNKLEEKFEMQKGQRKVLK